MRFTKNSGYPKVITGLFKEVIQRVMHGFYLVEPLRDEFFHIRQPRVLVITLTVQ